MQLEEMRVEMDGINNEMLALFKKRMELSLRMADCKRRSGMPIQDVQRESETIERMSEASGELPERYTAALFRELMRLSRDYQTYYLGGGGEKRAR